MFSHIKELFTRPSGYTIARSVRLRSSASGYFSRTPSASSRTTWTWTAWVKRGKLGSAQALFSAGTGTAEFRLTFTSSDTIEIYEYTSPSYNWQKITTAVYRDPSAWYQIQLVYDTTNGTAGDRVKLYVNSVQVTSFGTNTNPTPSFSGYVNSAVAHGIGSFSTGSSYLDGYLTEINFIDGQALTPSSFGETDSITGVWKAKKYSGTYGTNGFYLNFSDNSSNTSTTIGKDYSGNGNNWTPNNISVTSGSTYDSMVDSPTVSAVSSNYCVLNPLSDTSVTLSEGNLKGLTIINNANTRCNSTIAVSSGKWYFETYLGVAGTNTAVGIGQNNITDQYPANDALSFAQEIDNARKGNNNTFTSYGTALVAGDIFMCAFDLDNNKIFFGKNGTWFNSSDPSAGTSPAFTLTAGLYTPIFRPYGNTSGYIQVNFGQQPFVYTPPTGFVALNTYNLPASTIKNGAAYMAATTFDGITGGGSVVNTVNGVSFQPDMVWMKVRNNLNNHELADSVRGTAYGLFPNLTNAEVSDTRVSAFNSNGFSYGTNSNSAITGRTVVGWQWKAGGSSSSNTNGSITSTVSVGATQGFSVVTYTGTGANATVGHGLGVAPNMVIVKSRTNGTTSWAVYHSNLTSASYYLFLDSTSAQSSNATVWNSTAPTSTVFSIGTATPVNQSSNTFVAYCFAAVAGYSAFGSYTGNGSADGPFVYTGFRPRWIMWKNSSTGGTDWTIVDSSRNTYNVANSGLQPNGSYAEASNSNYQIDFLSNGFKLRTTNAEANQSGISIIYACFAESPFKTSLAR